MILAMRLFMGFLLVLAYCGDRYITHSAAIALFFLAWLGVYAVFARERRRR